MKECQFCQREFANAGALASHLRSCSKNPDRNPWKHTPWNKGKETGQVPWNKGKTKETDARMNQISEKTKGRRLGGFTNRSEDTKKKLSEIAKNRKLKLIFCLCLQ